MTERMQSEWKGLPGAELVRQGMEDLTRGELTEESLLVLLGEVRLARLGIVIESRQAAAGVRREMALYRHLGEKHGLGAHSRYNALVRRLVSFCRALERKKSRDIREKGESITT